MLPDANGLVKERSPILLDTGVIAVEPSARIKFLPLRKGRGLAVCGMAA